MGTSTDQSATSLSIFSMMVLQLQAFGCHEPKVTQSGVESAVKLVSQAAVPPVLA